VSLIPPGTRKAKTPGFPRGAFRERLAVALFPVLLLAAGCSRAPDGAEAPAGEKPVPVTVTGPRRGTVRSFLEVSADCEAESVADLRARVGGEVAEVEVREGATVTKGDVLFSLDSREAELDVRKAELNLELARLSAKEAETQVRAAEEALARAELGRVHARTEYERVAALEKGTVGAVSEDVVAARKHDYDEAVCETRRCQVDLEKAKVAARIAASKVKDAEVALEEAKLALSYRRVRAPIDGQVVSFDLHIGDYVTQGQLVARIEKADRLFVRFEIAQSEIRKVKSGQPVIITTQAFPERRYAGVVETVNRAVDRERGTVRARVRIDEPKDLLPGLFVVGRIVLEERRGVWVLPREVLRFEEHRPYVWYVDGENRARRGEVEVGITEEDTVEILSFGLDGEIPERVVLMGNVKDGTPVSVVERAAGEETAGTSTSEQGKGG